MDLPPVLSEQLLVHPRAELGPRTTLGVGGPAPWVIEPRAREELMLAVAELSRAGVPWRMLGHGSNLLVCDGGVPEVVIHTRLMRGIWHHGEREDAMRVEAGASLARLVSVCQQLGLSGVEALVGIPGTLGGAVAGNAGSRHGCIGDVLVAVTVARDDGTCEELPCTPEQFAYRSSPFAGRVVLDAVLQLTRSDPDTVQARVAEILRAKKDSQPLTARSAGCMFRNTEDAPSGRLIEEAGCKGLVVGGARVSDRHANFVLNEGGATAADVLGVVEAVTSAVRRSTGHELQLEVEVWGAPAEAAEAPGRGPAERAESAPGRPSGRAL
ncbi:MAG: UDP-N-acetylmuramate dehydrogenase [Planctomycetota bacterium]|jgi:UDP-N-acetylmuramate dehydrogenase